MARAALSPERFQALDADIRAKAFSAPGTVRYGMNREPGKIDGRVNLVRHHPDTEPAGKLGDPAQFVDGVHRSRRVVRIAQQVGDLPDLSGPSAGTRERFLQCVQINSAVDVKRRFDHSAAVVRHECVERGVDRRVDDDGVTAVGDQT